MLNSHFFSLTGSYSAINLLIDGKGLIIHYISNNLKVFCGIVERLNMEQFERGGHVTKIGLCQVLRYHLSMGSGGWNEAARTG